LGKKKIEPMKKHFHEMRRFMMFAMFATASMWMEAQVSWNIKGAYQLNMSDRAFEDNKALSGGRIGGGLTYRLSRMWAIQPSLYVSLKGMKLSSEYTKGEERMNDTVTVTEVKKHRKIRALYLEMPINIQLRIPVGKGNTLLLATGPFVAYGIGGKTHYEKTVGKATKVGGDAGDAFLYTGSDASYSKTVENVGTFDKDGMGFRRFDMGWNWDMGLQIKKMIVDIYLTYGMVSLDRDTGFDYALPIFTRHNISFGVGAGYEF
jgi:hypothetical protein